MVMTTLHVLVLTSCRLDVDSLRARHLPGVGQAWARRGQGLGQVRAGRGPGVGQADGHAPTWATLGLHLMLACSLHTTVQHRHRSSDLSGKQRCACG